jgi:hypothetical protein
VIVAAKDDHGDHRRACHGRDRNDCRVSPALLSVASSSAAGLPLTSRALWALLYIAPGVADRPSVWGMIVPRHTAGAITGLLMWSFVHREPVSPPALPEGVRHFLPFSAGYRLLDAGPNFEAPVTIANQLARPEYALIFAGYALASLAIGTLLLYRRDTN